jgi:hypothetical protein
VIPPPRRLQSLGITALLAVVVGGAAASAPGAAVSPELLAKARERGTVRVIVQLRVPSGADPEAVKTAVLGEIAPSRHRVVRELRGLPTLALDASEETLRLLSASSNILHVQEDVLERPQR